MKNYENLFYEIEDIPLDLIVVGKRFDRVDNIDLQIEEFSKEIKDNGMHTEIWVKKESETEFLLISGYRRYLSHKMLGKETIRARIHTIDDLSVLYMTCSENSNRINYSNFEKIENFLYILHKEFINRYQNVADDFIPARYINASKRVVLALSSREKGDLVPMSRYTADEKILSEIVEKVYKQSGLFSSYYSLYLMIKLEQMSPDLKKFCVENAIPVGGINALSHAENIFLNKTILIAKTDLSADAKRVPLFPILLKEVKELDSRSLPFVEKIIKKYKRKLNTYTGVKPEEVEKKLDFFTDNLRPLLLDKDTTPAIQKRVAKLFLYVEKQISLISKQSLIEKQKKEIKQ